MGLAHAERPYWPTRQQEFLLRAADPRGQSDPSPWRQWRAMTDFDEVDGPSQRLVPLLYENLRRQDLPDPDLGRYKGFYRRAWYINQILFHRLEEVLRTLREAGIPTLLVDGTALVLRYYRDHGLRPIHRGNIVVPPDQAPRAVRLLRAGGWQLIGRFPRCRTWVLRGGPDDQCVVVQGHVLPGFSEGAADADFWEAAEAIRFQEEPTRILSRTDQLLGVCASGILGIPIPVLAWSVDLVSVLHADGPAIDWERLLHQAGRCRMTLTVREALGYVHRTLAAPVPAEVLAALERTPTTFAERMLYEAKTVGGLPPGRVVGLWLREVRKGGLAFLGMPGALSRYFQDLWYVPKIWHLPGHAVLRASRKAVGRPRVLSPADRLPAPP